MELNGMERIELFLEYLKEMDCYEIYIERFREERGCRPQVGFFRGLDPWQFISCAFEWDKTEEGADFWKDVFLEIRRLFGGEDAD